MYLMSIMTSITMTLSLMIMLLTTMLSKKKNEDREKSSPFECGFDPKSSARMPFSLRFFMIAIIFLIFDVEIALLLPMPIIMFNSQPKVIMITGMFFLMMLLTGLYHEWNQGSLEWAS